MTLPDFSAPPFTLDAEARAWVAGQLAQLDSEAKLRQLFNLLVMGDDPAALDRIAAFGPGGITRHVGGDADSERRLIAAMDAAVPTPLLVAADLEGSRMSLRFGLEMPNHLALAAADDPALTEAIGHLMAREARSVGINWTFTPVIDINAAFRSAIVATRSFGSEIDRIERHALALMRGLHAGGVAATAKHWPGEGYDDRDQHLVTTINPLDRAEWDLTFGRLYRALIEAGVAGVMSAHIALPDYAMAHGIDVVEACRPASVSRLLTDTLLRGELGFDGLVVSDATPMAGLGSWAPRSATVPDMVAAGCDVILFSDDPEADLGYLRAALDDGRLTEARVDQAVARQLALKAWLGLHRPALPEPFVPGDVDRALVERAHRAAPTLVKDVAGLLPLSPEKHRRILVVTPGIVFPFLREPLPFALPEMLRSEGFDVSVYKDDTVVSRERFDLVLYLFGDETLLTRGRIFLDWLRLTGHFGQAMRRYWHEMPCLLVSFGYPYLLYDAPRMPTAVNAYASTETMQRAVCDLLLGRGAWTGSSPVDPFCGLPDARF